MKPFLFVCILTGLIHFTETIASSMRLAGVRTRNIATSLSFVNATLLVSRLSNMLQAPILGGMVDTAILTGDTSSLLNQFRIVVFAAFIGNVIGAMLVPFFVSVFTEGIIEFEKVGSLPKLLIGALHPRNLLSAAEKVPPSRPQDAQGHLDSRHAEVVPHLERPDGLDICYRGARVALCGREGPGLQDNGDAAVGDSQRHRHYTC